MGKTEACGECDGSGRVPFDIWEDGQKGGGSAMKTCPKCRGSGEVTAFSDLMELQFSVTVKGEPLPPEKIESTGELFSKTIQGLIHSHLKDVPQFRGVEVEFERGE